MSKFDNDLKIGDLTTFYRAGYFKVTQVERRFYVERDAAHAANMGCGVGDEYNSSIYAVQLTDSEGKPRKSKTLSCDSSYCSPINRESIKEFRDAEITEAEKKYAFLLQLIEAQETAST